MPSPRSMGHLCRSWQSGVLAAVQALKSIEKKGGLQAMAKEAGIDLMKLPYKCAPCPLQFSRRLQLTV